MEVDKTMLFTGIVFTLIGILARTYAGISEIHDSTWEATAGTKTMLSPK